MVKLRLTHVVITAPRCTILRLLSRVYDEMHWLAVTIPHNRFMQLVRPILGLLHILLSNGLILSVEE